MGMTKESTYWNQDIRIMLTRSASVPSLTLLQPKYFLLSLGLKIGGVGIARKDSVGSSEENNRELELGPI